MGGKPMHVCSIANQKGGVGKTTTTQNLGMALGKKKKVLLIDLDAQGNLTDACGLSSPEYSAYEVLSGDRALADSVFHLRACLETSAFIVTRRHVDKKRLCAAAKTREDCQTVPQRSDGQRMGACTSSPAPCFWRRSEAQNRPA